MKHELVYSALVTPDGTVLESLHRHDFKKYFDETKLRWYMIDGGLDYIRSSAWGDEKFISVYADESFDKVRQYAFRMDLGKDKQWTKIPLKDLADEKLGSVLEILDDRLSDLDKETNTHYQLLLKEKDYRKNGNPV